MKTTILTECCHALRIGEKAKEEILYAKDLTGVQKLEGNRIMRRVNQYLYERYDARLAIHKAQFDIWLKV